MSKANETQVGGTHYNNDGKLQHWDVVVLFELDYFQAQISRYIFRHKKKNGIEDVRKASHYIAKYLEVLEAEEAKESMKQHAAGNNVDGARGAGYLNFRSVGDADITPTPYDVRNMIQQSPDHHINSRHFLDGRAPNGKAPDGTPQACPGCGAFYWHHAGCVVVAGAAPGA